MTNPQTTKSDERPKYSASFRRRLKKINKMRPECKPMNGEDFLKWLNQ